MIWKKKKKMKMQTPYLVNTWNFEDNNKIKDFINLIKCSEVPYGLLLAKNAISCRIELYLDGSKIGEDFYLIYICTSNFEPCTVVRVDQINYLVLFTKVKTALNIIDNTSLATSSINNGIMGVDSSVVNNCVTGVNSNPTISFTASNSILQSNKIIAKNENTNIKEKNNMNMPFDFGFCTDEQVRMSFYGLAVKNVSGKYVSYNAETNEIIDVDIINFKGGKFFYKMPVAIRDVAAGDIIIHARKPMFVKKVNEEEKTIVAIDPCAGEEKTIMITRSPFGFDFCTKIISLIDMNKGKETADSANPFGNMLPFLLMSESEDKNEINPLLFMAMGNENFKENPMMMYFLMSNDNKNKDLLPMMFMMSQFQK